jgi:hypothetical protein
VFIAGFLNAFGSYFLEVFPALALGLVASGIIHEFIPTDWINRYMGKAGIKPLLYATVVGAIAPVCCWGALPIAVSFHKKGASLGPIFAILVATPATSINALFVTWKLMGLQFTVYIFFAVIVMGLCAGLLGNLLKVNKTKIDQKASCHKKEETSCECSSCSENRSLPDRIRLALKYACIDMPKEIGIEIIIGLVLAALVVTISPIGEWIKSYLVQGYAYLFALIFGLIMYMCSTMSVALIHAFASEGMEIGAAMSLLILGPIASFGTVLVLKKEFGFKVLLLFLGSVCSLSLLAGYLFALW